MSLAAALMTAKDTQAIPYDDHESSHPTIYPHACASPRRDDLKSARAPRMRDTALHVARVYTPIGIAAAALVILMLAACGDDGSASENSATAAAMPAATPTPRATPTPAATQTQAPPALQAVTPVSAADGARL